MTTATDKFRIGDAVMSTQKALDNGVFTAPRTGTVVGFGRRLCTTYRVRVLMKGRRTSESYHMDFWDVVRRGRG